MEPNYEYFKCQADVISKVYPNDVRAKMLTEELRISYNACRK